MESVVKSFEIDPAAVQDDVEKMLAHMQDGLSLEEPPSMKMLPAFTDVPAPDVTGTYLAIDFGGTNLRCLLERIEKGKLSAAIQHKVPVEPRTEKGSDLYAALGKVVADFIKDHEAELPPPPAIIPAGYTFSFPVKQTRLDSGILTHWTKEFIADNCVDHDHVVLLQQELNRRGLDRIKVVALCNDTVGTLCAHRLNDHNTVVGVILGTGTNASYREKTANIKKLDAAANYTATDMLINMEWGSFNEMSHNPIDEALWEHTEDPKAGRFEKMISGRYCPLIAAEAINFGMDKYGFLADLQTHMKAAAEKAGEKVEGIVRYDPTKQLSLKEMSGVHHDTTPDLAVTRATLIQHAYPGLSAEADSIKISPEELKLVKELFTNIAVRSARLAGIAMAAVVCRITMYVEVMPEITISVDGSVFHFYTGYADEIRATVAKCLESVRGKPFKGYKDAAGSLTAFPTSFPKVNVVPTEDGSGIGAAVIVAANAK